MNLRTHVHQHALGSQTLRTVRGDGIAMIEVPHLVCIEAHDSVFGATHADADLAIVPDVLDGAQIAIGNLQVSLWSCKLDFVPDSKFTLDLAVGGDAAQPRWVIGDCWPSRFWTVRRFSLRFVATTWA